jgi:hypothetical protein
MIDYPWRYVIILLAFVISMILTSILVRLGIPLLKSASCNDPDQSINSKHKMVWYSDIGFWIGFFETIIIFVFVLNKEFSGLALIFGAKEFVRKEEIIKDPAYYLLGTLINLGISIVIVEIAMKVISINQIV